MKYHHHLFLLFFVLPTILAAPQQSFSPSASGPCLVVEKASQQEKACKFPFKFKDNIYFGCTDNDDPDGKAWCSTKTDDDGEHIGRQGVWGHCPSRTDLACDIVPPAPRDIVETANGVLEPSLPFHVRNYFDPSLGILSSLKAESCPCVELEQCHWGMALVDLGKIYPPGYVLRENLWQILRSSVCEGSTVHCCALGQTTSSPTSPPTTPPPLVTPDPSISTFDFPTDKNLGTWKPRLGECGLRTTTESIIGGENVKLGEFPHMALLVYEVDGKDSYLCGGSVINSWYVMTAAHCHTKDRPIKRVILGEHTLGENPDCIKDFCGPPMQDIPVAKVVQHEEWNPARVQRGRDIALIRLANQAILNSNDGPKSYVRAVCLPWNENDPGRNLVDNDDLIITGWGRVTNNERISQETFARLRAGVKVLQKVTIPGVSRQACQENSLYRNINPDIQLCAGGLKGKDSCNGDSGGPLVYRLGNRSDSPWYQVGIVSYGHKTCGLEDTPAIYTRVSAYLPWIAAHMEP